MIGIQLCGERGSVAISTDSGPEVVGTDLELAELVSAAKERLAEECENGVVAVPAWFNDVQRSEVLSRVRHAGIVRPLIANEPTAAALAFALSRAAMPKRSLVLSLSNGTFDATVLSLNDEYIEVLSTDGIPTIKAETASNSDLFFAEIKPAIGFAVEEAGGADRPLDAIILTGETAPFRSVSAQIATAFGRAPEEPPDPETAICRGAVLYGRMRERGLGPKPAADAGTSSEAGCASVVLVAVACGAWFIA